MDGVPPLRERGRHHGARQERTATRVRRVQLVVVTITWLVCIKEGIEKAEATITIEYRARLKGGPHVA